LLTIFFPKGTTWMTDIVRNILYISDKDLLGKAKRIQSALSYLEYGPGRNSKNVNELLL